MKRGLVAGFLFALVVGLAWWSNGSNTTYTVQEALNRLIGAKPTEYTTQGALNVILTKPAERDTLVTLFTWIFDDGTDSLWTEYSAWVDSFAAYNQVGTISIMPYKCLHDDTTGTWLSKSDVLALEARGWDIEGHGYNGDDNLWAATGTYDMAEGINSKADYVRDMNRCMAGFDTLGLRTPRGFSWPTSGAHQIAIEAAQQAGFDYGFTNSVTATNGIRYNFRTEIDRLTGYRYVSAYPGVLPNRWEIGQCIGMPTTSARSALTSNAA